MGEGISAWRQLPFCLYGAQKEPMRKFLDYLIKQVKNTNTTIQLNKEATTEAIKQFAAEAVVLAHGAKHVPVEINGTQRNGVLNVKNAFLSADSLGNNIAIVGGGPEGCELADFLASRGKKITVIEMMRVLGLGLVAHPVIMFVNVLIRWALNYISIQRSQRLGIITWLSVAEESQTRNWKVLIISSSPHSINPTLHLPNLFEPLFPEVYIAGDAVEGVQHLRLLLKVLRSE